MIKYYKLLDMLNRRSMTKETLRQQIGISSATMSKISSHKTVSLDVIDKICCALDCQPGDIIEYVPSSVQTDTHIEARQKITGSKHENHYEAFTDEEEKQIDLNKLSTNIKYQLDIALKFGESVLASLMEKARQQEKPNKKAQ